MSEASIGPFCRCRQLLVAQILTGKIVKRVLGNCCVFGTPFAHSGNQIEHYALLVIMTSILGRPEPDCNLHGSIASFWGSERKDGSAAGERSKTVTKQPSEFRSEYRLVDGMAVIRSPPYNRAAFAPRITSDGPPRRSAGRSTPGQLRPSGPCSRRPLLYFVLRNGLLRSCTTLCL
jgi:hypothetical protein